MRDVQIVAGGVLIALVVASGFGLLLHKMRVSPEELMVGMIALAALVFIVSTFWLAVRKDRDK